MKKKGISPEFLYVPIAGTYNMKEQRSFYGSKMMNIENEIFLDNKDIVYYQQLNGEQIDLNQEMNIDAVIYSILKDKNDNHTIEIDPNQSDIERNLKTKWIITIKIDQILNNYIFSNIKSNRTFKDILNKDTASNSVNTSIREYIKSNIIDNYKNIDFEFFTSYKNLSENSTQRFKTNYNQIIELKENKVNDIRILLDDDNEVLNIYFTQKEDSNYFTFDYYFNIYFSKK